MEERRLIYLLRHGEPDAGLLGDGAYMIGQYDLPLTAKGHASAQEMAEHLKEIPFTRIISSDLTRAKDTAAAVAALQGKKVEATAALREIALGEWEGRNIETIPDAAKKDRGADFADYVIPGGETFRQFSARVWEAFQRIREENTGPLLLVSHAGVNRMILCNLLEIPLQNQFILEQEYCHYHILAERRGIIKLYKANCGF